MTNSLFPEYVQKWFEPLIKKIKETINGSVASPKYLFKSMLKESYSTTLQWGSLSSNGTVVAADVVSMNSSLPLKRRDSIGKAVGDIAKSGMELALNEKQLTDIDILKARGDKETQVVAKLFADTQKCAVGVEELIEMMFLTALSTGLVIVPSEDNDGIGIRADFGHPSDQRFGVQVKWAEGNDAKVADDIENVLSKASLKGVTLTQMYMDTATFNYVRKSAQIKSLYSSDLQISDPTNVPVPNKKKAMQLIADEYGLEIILVDRAVVLEKSGKRRVVKPWYPGSVSFLATPDAGELQYGTLAEENHPVSGVVYSKPTSYTLVSKYSTNKPSLAEITSSQALVIPVIDVDNLFLMDTTEAEEVDDAEVEGDADITIWGTQLVKATVISALNEMNIATAVNIGDATLIEKINQLSDENEEVLKDALGL